jgi:hypothetical protein
VTISNVRPGFKGSLLGTTIVSLSIQQRNPQRLRSAQDEEQDDPEHR